jgi:Rad3-related DNA helicase
MDPTGWESSRVSLTRPSGRGSKEESLLLPHQRFVALYLDPLSPYRGLLLYHGLGTGKTCASIAVAQSFLEANKRVVVLAPASLRKISNKK